MTISPRFSVDVIRAAVGRAVDESSLREVADQVPISWTGLRKFLNGGNPHRATIEKLTAWFIRSRKGRTERFPRAEVDAAIAFLAQFVADAAGESVRERRRRGIAARLGF